VNGQPDQQGHPMLHYKYTTHTSTHRDFIECDKCHHWFTRTTWQDVLDEACMLQVSMTCGSASAIGKGKTVKVDLCEPCWWPLLEPYCHVSEPGT
jgi:hypothetical protein